MIRGLIQARDESPTNWLVRFCTHTVGMSSCQSSLVSTSRLQYLDMAVRDATKILMSSQLPHATERPTGTPPVGKFAWTDRTSLPFDMDAIYVPCYSGSVSTDADSLVTSRWADSSGVKAVATALRKMHDGKVSVERLAPVAQFIVNCTAWGKMKAAMLDEPRLMRQLGVIETATTNVATAKRDVARGGHDRSSFR